ncbi:MAG: geranylgeranyl reductase family protein [Bacteroidales bacterium]|nr:geranylgeranyl reductase family protein [Bacteroidales bacterium]
MSGLFDVVIVGAGPSGCACAIGLINSGLKVAIMDKSSFPREKVCGDGLTLDVIRQLPLISKKLETDFFLHKQKFASKGVKIYTIDNKTFTIPVLQHHDNKSMFTLNRSTFDNILFEHLKNNSTHTSIIENCKLDKIEKQDNLFKLHTSKGVFESRFIVGADGANSVVSKQLHLPHIYEKDKVVALRCFYKNLNMDNADSYMRFYFNKIILPGYIWVFPEADGLFNVGLGMSLTQMKNHKVNMLQVLESEIKSGSLREVFKNAERVSPFKAKIIPLGKNGRPISGKGYLLTGDAAGLANAVTGEGIGNALRSGRVAAEHIKQCFTKGYFTRAYNLLYDKEIYKRMGREFDYYRLVQFLCSFPQLNSFLVGKAAKVYLDVYGDPICEKTKKSFFFWSCRIIKSLV